MLTPKQRIKRAAKVFALLDPDYKRHDIRLDDGLLIQISKKQANRIVDMSPKDTPPTAVEKIDGAVILYPPPR